MAIVGQLEIQLLADVARLKRDMAEAKTAVQQTAGVMTQSLNFLKGAFSVGAAVAWAKSILDAGDAAVESSQKVGMAVEEYSALQLAFRMGGVDTEKFKTGIVGMSKSIDDNADAWKELGIKTADAQGHMRPTQDLLMEAADIFAALPEGITRTRLATVLFNKGGADLIPTLIKGSAGIREMTQAAKDSGAVMSGSAARAADEFNDHLALLGARATATALAVTEGLWPTLIELSKILLEISQISAGEGIKQLAKDITDFVATTGKELITIGEWVDKLMLSLGLLYNVIAAKSPKDVVAVYEEWKDRIKAVGDEADKQRARIGGAAAARVQQASAESQYAAAVRAATEAGGKQALNDAERAIRAKELAAERAKAAEAARREAEAEGKRVQAGMDIITQLETELFLEKQRAEGQKQASEELRAYLKVEQDVIDGKVTLNAAGLSWVNQLIRERSAIKEAKDARIAYSEEQAKNLAKIGEEAETIAEQVAQQQAANQSAITGVDAVGLLAVAKLEKLAIDKEERAIMGAAYGESQAVYEGYMLQAKGLQELADKKRQGIDIAAFKKATDSMTEFARQAQRSIQDALGDTLERMLEGNFNSIEQMWAALIRRMIAQAMAAQLNKWLFGTDTANPFGGGVVGSLIGWMTGGGGGGGGTTGDFSRMDRALPAGASRESAQAITLNDNRTFIVGDVATKKDVAKIAASGDAQTKIDILRSRSRNGAFQ